MTDSSSSFFLSTALPLRGSCTRLSVQDLYLETCVRYTQAGTLLKESLPEGLLGNTTRGRWFSSSRVPLSSLPRHMRSVSCGYVASQQHELRPPSQHGQTARTTDGFQVVFLYYVIRLHRHAYLGLCIRIRRSFVCPCFYNTCRWWECAYGRSVRRRSGSALVFMTSLTETALFRTTEFVSVGGSSVSNRR